MDESINENDGTKMIRIIVKMDAWWENVLLPQEGQYGN